MDNLVVLVPISGVIALAFAYMKAQWVRKQDAGTEEMQEIARRI
jgi:K(+)-stimulated pyrophosphate-energized sodium pump